MVEITIDVLIPAIENHANGRCVRIPGAIHTT
jgi:hypothetical protein